MRRTLSTAAFAAFVLVGVVTTGGCRSAATDPTVASVNFSPKADLAVDQDGRLVVTSDTDSTEPFTLPAGSVVTIANDSDHDQRVTGTLDGSPSIDTGTIQPGQAVTVVLGTAGALELRPNADGKGPALVITVAPRAA